MSENRFSGKTYFYTIAYSAQKESGSNLSRTGTGRSSFGIILKDKFQKNPNVYFPTKEGVAGDKATSCSSEDGDEGGNGEGENRAGFFSRKRSFKQLRNDRAPIRSFQTIFPL